MTHLTRRAALTAGAALPLAAAVATPGPGRADGHAAPLGFGRYRRFMIGDAEVTTLLTNTLTNPNDPQGIFGMNVDAETFEAVSTAAFLPTDKSQFFFTPTLVRTGTETVLFDTGQSAADITAALDAAGHAPGDVTRVVITHMHGDHVGGLMDGDAVTFENASYHTTQPEMDHWANSDSESFQTKVAPLRDRFEMVADGQEPVAGITAMAMHGHTPGHTGYMISSGDQSLLLVADLANHYVWSLGHPDWEVRFDMDKAAAAATRRRVLGMLASERMPMVGYHMPFPAVGFVETRGDGFHWVPESYQLML